MELVPLPYELSPRPPSDRRACPHRRLPGRRQPFAHAHLLEDEGLEPWDVTEIWLINGRESNHYVDITDTFERKIAALRAHASQIAHPDSLVERMRERIAPNTPAAGLPEGRYAEAFQVVANQ